MKRTRAWWLGFGVFAAFLVAGLLQISRVTLELEDQNLRVNAEMKQRERLRDALWNIDIWLGQILDDEADRAPDRTWFEPLPGDLVSSPLVSEDKPLFVCRFESNPLGAPTISDTVPAAFDNAPSPKAIMRAENWLANNDLEQTFQEASAMTCSQIETSNTLVQEIQSQQAPTPLYPLGNTELSEEDIRAALAAASTELNGAEPQTPVQTAQNAQSYGNNRQVAQQQLDFESQSRRNIASLKSRSQRFNPNFQAADFNGQVEVPPPPASQPGVLLPYWFEEENGARQLMFLRRVIGDSEMRVQGFIVDWGVLRNELHALVDAILPGLQFEPLVGDAVRDLRWVGCSLGSLPLGLVMPPPPIDRAEGLTPARIALGLTWFAVLGAIAIAFASLRSSVAFGERRSRFASAVTHELRTPLTTFQLYSEMLADGMVPDEERRKEYLETLRSESQRLSGLVESVLAYSRLEEGRDPRRREQIALATWVERARDRWATTLGAADLNLHLTVEEGETQLFTDLDALEQVMTNLVENAAKYAAGSDPARVDVTCRGQGSRIELTVRDFGPGIPADCARRIFSPFDRAGRESGNLPGAGLGLSISRALARDLGGELRLVENGEPGATFQLRLPGQPR